MRPLDPPLFLDLEVVWRRPARPAVRRLVDFLVEAADGPEVLVSAPRRCPADARRPGPADTRPLGIGRSADTDLPLPPRVIRTPAEPGAVAEHLRRGRQHEGSGLRGAAAGQRQGRTGRADRAADRRAGADHVGEHLRLGPAHVRGPDRLRARPLVRAREPRPGGRGRRRGRQGPGRRLRRPAVQHRLRALQELRAPAHELLPDRPAGAEHGRRRVRLRRHGPVRRRTGRAAARALGRLQLPAAGRGRRAAADRLRDARRHLPDRLPRHRDGRRAARRPDGHLRRRTGRADGRPLGDHPRGRAR